MVCGCLRGSIYFLDTFDGISYLKRVQVHQLNRESRENRERSRRCDPARTLRRPVAPIRFLVRLIIRTELTAGRGYLTADRPAH